VGLIAVVLGLFLAVGELAIGNYKGATFKCSVEGPSSELAEISERSDVVTGYPTMWPLGRGCEWDRADGPGTIVALGLLGGGIALAGSALLRPVRRTRPGREPD
jgi:hypothetical protein